MQVGPCYRQAFNGKGNLPFDQQFDRRIFRQWVMFSGYGTDICDVRYSQVDADGNKTKLDRFEVLGHESWLEAPKSLKRITSEGVAVGWARKLCGVIEREQEDPDVRLVARCGTHKGWRWVRNGKQNMCELPMNWKPRKRKK